MGAAWDPDQPYPEKRFFGFYDGFVKDRADPDNLGRVKVEVPGIIEETDWAYAFGIPGGGSPQRGFWWVPDVGASVLVCFIAGDIDQPRWTPSHWGDDEVPTGADPDVVVVETKLSIIEIDDRNDTSAIRIRAKDSDNKLEIDIKNGTVTLQGASKVIVDGTDQVVLNSGQVLLGSDGAGEPVPLGNKLNDFLSGILDLLKSMGPLGNLGAPVAFTTDTLGANSFGAGGVVSVTSAMKAAIDQHLSQKVNTE